MCRDSGADPCAGSVEPSEVVLIWCGSTDEPIGFLGGLLSLPTNHVDQDIEIDWESEGDGATWTE